MDHRRVDHGIACGHKQFVVSTESTVTAEPSEGALDHPAAWQELEAFDRRVTLDDFQVKARKAMM